MERRDVVIQVRRQLGHVLVTVAGDLDVVTAGLLRDRLTGPAAGGQQIIVDLAGVAFIDAAGLRVLARAAALAAARGGSMWLAAASQPVRRLLALTGMERRIPVAVTVAQARAALRRGPGN